MSLLLDALKSTEPEPAAADTGVEPEASDPQEELLDGRATLALLVSKPSAQATLSLVPTSSVETVSPAAVPEVLGSATVEPRFLEPSLAQPSFVEPSSVGRSAVGSAPAGLGLAPAPVAEIVRAAPTAERASGATGAPVRGPAAAAAATKRATVAAPSARPRAKAYALAGAALAALVGIAILGKSLWWPTTNAMSYPRGGVPQIPPGAVEATTPSTAAVRVPSARPADQFAYTGNAPEIDLLDSESPTNARSAANAIAPALAAPSSATRRARGAAPRATTATLSVTRSQAPSPIDRHVQAGYQALSQGNVAKAQTEYSAALELDPNNVDALMGAASVAARGGNAKAAIASYAKVLELEPGNPDATAATSTLGANGSSGENDESRLKILIASGDGGRPALHAALAGVYAADARWAEAAQEYFTALAKDPGNPDLAFDVAASLDQNRNPGMALTYYRQALAFAGQRPTQVDLRAIEQRITRLQARAAHDAPGAPETR